MPECRLERVSEHIWWFTPDERTDRPSLAAVAGSRSTLLLEAGASVAHTASFLATLEPLTLPPLIGVALTHWHWDHSFGAAAIPAPLIAHRETAAELAVQRSYDWSDAALGKRVTSGQEIAFVRDMLKLEIPNRTDLEIRLPDTVFDHRHDLDLGGVSVELHHVGGDHAADSVVMWVPGDGLLFLGDSWYQRLYAPVEHYTLTGLRALVERLATFDVTAAIEGHSEALLDGSGFRERLHELTRAADLVEKHGQGATKLAAGEDEREVVTFLLAGEGGQS